MKFSDSLERASTRRSGPAVHRWTDDEFRRQRDDDLRIEAISTRQVLAAVTLCLGIAALLTSGNLVEAAERRPYGASRDAVVAVVAPIDRVANFFSLNRPADLVDRLRFGQPEPSFDPLAVASGAPTTQGVEPAPGTGSTAAQGATGDEPASSPETTKVPPTTLAPEPKRVVNSTKPLVLLVAGDSQAEYPGQALTNRAVTAKVPYTVSVDSRIATGLARPDYFNWPAQLATVSPDVEAIVLFFGGNDFQDMELGGERLVRGTPEWFAEYRRRIEVTLDVLESADRQVFWIAPPPIRDQPTSEALQELNRSVREAATSRPWVRVVPVDQRFAPSGKFVAYLADADGVDVRVRSGDGVHFTPKGASWVADMVVAEIGDYWTVE